MIFARFLRAVVPNAGSCTVCSEVSALVLQYDTEEGERMTHSCRPSLADSGQLECPACL